MVSFEKPFDLSHILPLALADSKPALVPYAFQTCGLYAAFQSIFEYTGLSADRAVCG